MVHISLAATDVLVAKVVDILTAEQKMLLHTLVFEYN
jgi:hypothetical protein